MKYCIINVGEFLGSQNLGVDEAGDLKKALEKTIGSQIIDSLILNMSATRYIDSSGLGVLVSAFKLMKQRGGNVKLYALQPLVKNVLDITRMTQVFEVIDDLPPPDDPDAGVPARRRPPPPSDFSEATVDETEE